VLTAASAGQTFGVHQLSQDGRRLAMGGWEIVVLDLARGVPTTVARSPLGRPMQFPVWSPGDTAIAFVTADSGRNLIAVVDTRTGESRIVFTGVPGRAIETTDWSTDSRYVLFSYAAGGGSSWSEVWMLDLA
jgi:Tol biopolymer transport system component